MQTQCLLQGRLNSDVEVHVRFLHVVRRDVGQLNQPASELPAEGEPPFTLVPSLKVGERQFYAWEEAIERQVVASSLTMEQLLAEPAQIPFRFSGARELEPLRAADGSVAGVLIRSRMTIEGEITIAATEIVQDVFQLTVRIENLKPIDAPPDDRDEIRLRAFASTHHPRLAKCRICFTARSARRARALKRNNQGTWPVLAGEQGGRTFCCRLDHSL
jgi:hydrogenase maturation protease